VLVGDHQGIPLSGAGDYVDSLRSISTPCAISCAYVSISFVDLGLCDS
jgi:hypothetical protein